VTGWGERGAAGTTPGGNTMRRLSLAGLALAIALTLIFAACGGGSSNSSTTTQTPQQAQMFVNLSDAPLQSVLDFQITINSMTVTNGSSTATLVSTPTNFELTRLLGLRTLLGLNAVPAGTYTSATVTVSSPVITYLDTTTNPATVKTMNGSLTNSSFTIPINPGLVINGQGVGGLHLHFDLSQSLFTDTTGQITGQVNPTFTLRGFNDSSDPDWEIDEFLGTVASVNVSSSNFVFTRPDGRTFTIDTDSNTIWDGDGVSGLSNLAANMVVNVCGKVQADGSILADQVEVLSLNKSYMGGLILDVNPNSGTANNLTVLIREEIPTQATIPIYQPAQINLSSSTKYHIRYIPEDISKWVFNSGLMITGQRVGLAGDVDTTNSAQFDASRVTLRWQGHDGVAVAGSINTTNNTFMFNADGLLGYVFGAPVKVYTFPGTAWLGGLNGIGDLTGAPTQKIRVVGLVLKDPVTNTPALLAVRVRQLP
jgi:hypothetical protein